MVHSRQICLQTIQWYIDELHVQGGRAWAYVQSIAAEENNLANAAQGIYPLVNAQGAPAVLGPSGAGVTYPLDFANAAWAQHQVGVLGLGSRIARVRRDSLGHAGSHRRGLRRGDRRIRRVPDDRGALTVQPRAPSNHELRERLVVGRFIARRWSPFHTPRYGPWPSSSSFTLTMSAPAMQSRWGVMAFYPSVDMPAGWTQSQVMLARWNEAPQHNLHYLVIGDGSDRLVNEYFPSDVPLTAAEITALSQQ